jgi:hypothetical protein
MWAVVPKGGKKVCPVSTFVTYSALILGYFSDRCQPVMWSTLATSSIKSAINVILKSVIM